MPNFRVLVSITKTGVHAIDPSTGPNELESWAYYKVVKFLGLGVALKPIIVSA